MRDRSCTGVRNTFVYFPVWFEKYLAVVWAVEVGLFLLSGHRLFLGLSVRVEITLHFV